MLEAHTSCRDVSTNYVVASTYLRTLLRTTKSQTEECSARSCCKLAAARVWVCYLNTRAISADVVHQIDLFWENKLRILAQLTDA